MQTFLVLISLITGAVTSAFSQPNDTATIDKAVENYIHRHGFSGTILVAHQGQPIFHQSYGFAYYSASDTIQNHYHYSIASVTKLFTCIRILQLAEAGSLSLDEPIVEYLPQYETKISNQVTPHHLLLHISWLPEEKDKLYQHTYEPQDWAEKVLGYRRKNNIGQFNYNNLDYVLFGLIIEKLTGNSWEKEIEQAILKPLNMHETGWLAYGDYPRNFAYTYSKKRNRLQQDPLFYIENFYAAGSMYSTTLDLLKLDQALYSDRLLTAQSKQLLAQSYPEYNYAGYSVWNYQYPFAKGKPTIMERRGKILGANVVLVRLTDSHDTIIILSNDDRFNPDSFGDTENLRETLIKALYE